MVSVMLYLYMFCVALLMDMFVCVLRVCELSQYDWVWLLFCC